MTISKKRHSEVCKCCLCIFVCKYIYTKHTVQNALWYTIVGKKQKKLSLAYSFFL